MKPLLENFLTRIPMHRLVNALLACLVAAALALSAVGLLSFSPLALFVSTTVFVAVSAATSYVLGRLYGVYSHLSSAITSGLILSLLFTPSLDGSVLVQFVLIATLVQTSKFVVAWQGRHIFNPAAFGALVGGLLQLPFASWWVGTPVLVIAVAMAAFLLLYKTRQLVLSGVFLSISLTILMFKGIDLWTALSSWPLLFVAGFMLSEPLTLPPRRWQKIIVAAAVAVIICLPFHIGWFYSSPEFGLVAGNIVAFVLAWRQRSGVQLQLKQRRALTPTVDEFVFAASRPFWFQPGQYIELTLPHARQDMRGVRRSFSMTSTPGGSELRLGIKFTEPGSTFKNALRTLPKDTIIQTTGIFGDFTLPKNPHDKLLFIAGGIGITPFISQIVAGQEESRDITLLYFVRDPSEAAYKELLDESAITVHYFTAGAATDGFVKAATLTLGVITAYAADARERRAYISGPPAMVTTVKQLLRGKVRSIKTDYFSGY